MQTKQNQALTMHPLFFDPIYRTAYMDKKDGKIALKYRDDIWGVRLEDNGDVIFTMNAPSAETVLAAGVPIVTFEGYGYHDWTFWRHCANDFLRRLFK